MSENPVLRPIDFQPVQHQGEQMWLLRDPLQLSPRQLLVPPALAQVLIFCDGSRDLPEIHRAVSDHLSVGDTIKVQGVAGLVKEVKLAATVLSNEDNELITIPNKHIVGEIIHNSQADSILELEVGIDYRSDVEKSVKVIEDALRGIDGISTDRAPLVGIHEFGDSAVTLGVRIWVLTEKLFETRYRCNLAIFQALATNGINIPFPRRDVHVTGQTGSGPEPDSLP